MNESVGLQALSKLEDTIMKIIDLIMKILDKRAKPLEEQIDQLKKDKNALQKTIEDLRNKLAEHGKDYKDPKDEKNGSSIDEIIVSQEEKLEEVEKTIDDLQRQVDAIHDVKDKIGALKEPENIKILAQESLRRLSGREGQDLQRETLQQVVSEVVRERIENNLRPHEKDFNDLINQVTAKAEEINKANSDKNKGKSAKAQDAPDK